MEKIKKIYVEDYMPEDEEWQISSNDSLNQEKFEEYKSHFSIQKIVNEFLIKKQYFITHKKTDINLDYQFTADDIIGKGNFGSVYKATETITGQIRAIKQVMTKDIINYDGFINEVEALKTLDHPNIIKLFEVYEDTTCVYLVLEYCEGGDLFDYIVSSENERIEEQESAYIFHQMVSCIIYCHKNWIWHRDLKPDNFMLVNKVKNPTIKLIDFGLSRSFFKYFDNESSNDGKMFRMQTRAGTALYMAPEVLNKNYSNACDVWSLGVILFVMVSGFLPFSGGTDATISSAIKNLNYTFEDSEGVWDTLSYNVKDLIAQIFVYEQDRLTAKEWLKHKWIKKMLNPKGLDELDTNIVMRFEIFKEANNMK